MGYFLYDNSIKKTKKCVVCNKEFITTHPHKKTCSDGCSMILEQRTLKRSAKDTARYNKKRGR